MSVWCDFRFKDSLSEEKEALNLQVESLKKEVAELRKTTHSSVQEPEDADIPLYSRLVRPLLLALCAISVYSKEKQNCENRATTTTAKDISRVTNAARHCTVY